MNGDQDFTDPEFVVGAVLAQIEDLPYEQQIAVLADALASIVGAMIAQSEDTANALAALIEGGKS